MMSMVAVLSISGNAWSDVYVCVEDVDYENVTASTRFYDQGKGSYTWNYSTVRNAINLSYVERGDFSILGELATRLPAGTSSVTYDSFSGMMSDTLMCWAYSASNLIQYWQTYYGALYTGDKELPYGYTYNPADLTTLRGAQSLKVGMAFYDNWNDVAGNLSYATGWYCHGSDSNEGVKTTGAGGYWKSQVMTSNYSIGTGMSMDEIKARLLDGIGYEEDGNGGYVQTKQGRIAQLSIARLNVAVGHAITCYGVLLHDDGSLKGILVADSDDSAYGLTTYYLKKDASGYAILYKDEACTTSWSNFYLRGVGYMSAQTALENAKVQYYAAETPLEWSGATATWHANETLLQLPDAASGWLVNVGDTTYYSYFHAGRSVKFGDAAASTTVTVEGELDVQELILDNTQQNYTFRAGSGGALSMERLSTTGQGSAAFSGLSLETNTASYADYTLSLEAGSSLTIRNMQLQSGAVLQLSQSSLAAEHLTLGSGSCLTLAGSGNTIQLGALNLEDGATLCIDSPLTGVPLLTLSGNSVTGGMLELLFTEQPEITGDSYALFTLAGDSSVWTDVFTSSDARFEITDGVLYCIPQINLTWRSGDGVWSSSSWNGAEVETAGQNLVVSGSQDYTITIQGEVSALSLDVKNTQGTVSITAADESSFIMGDCGITKTGNGTLLMNAANTYTGGTRISGGELVAAHASALGSGAVVLENARLTIGAAGVNNAISASGSSSIHVSDGIVWNVSAPIRNNGTLALSGAIEAGGITDVTHVPAGKIDVNGNIGQNGFSVNEHSYFTLVEGGNAVANNLTLTHNGTKYTLGGNGVAVSGDGLQVDYVQYDVTSGSSVRSSEVLQASAGAVTRIALNGGTLYSDAMVTLVKGSFATVYLLGDTIKGGLGDTAVIATGGVMKASMGRTSSFTASGNVVLDSGTNNNHTGGTFLNGGHFDVCHSSFFGFGGITITGVTTLDASVENFEGKDNKFSVIRHVIDNKGSLTMIGNYDASELPLVVVDDSYTDASGTVGASGFFTPGGAKVQLVSGGTLIADATVTHGDYSLVLNNDGYAYENGSGTLYDTYYLKASDSVRVSAAVAASGGKLEHVEMTGGTLYADASTQLTATGGVVELSKGTLSGTIKKTRLNITGGELSAAVSSNSSIYASGADFTLSGTNSHYGINSFSNSTVRLSSLKALGSCKTVTQGNTTLIAEEKVNIMGAIQNSGTLTLSGGVFNFYALAYTKDYKSYTGIDGDLSTSGFRITIPNMIRFTSGGTVVLEEGARVMCDGYGCQIWSCGIGAVVATYRNYNVYVLNSGDTVAVSAAAAAQPGYFKKVELNGGLLEADMSVEVVAVSGTMHLTAGDISGTLQDTVIQSEDGILSAVLSGNTSLEVTGRLTLSGDNTHTGGSVFTDADVTLGHAHALGAGVVHTSGVTGLTATDTVVLQQSICNSGELTLNGVFNVDELRLTPTEEWTYLTAEGDDETSGFRSGAISLLQVVEGGRVSGDAVVEYRGNTYRLAEDGTVRIAAPESAADWSTYYLNAEDSVRVSEARIFSEGRLQQVQMSGGTLHADESVTVHADAGAVLLSAGTLSGGLRGDTSLVCTGDVSIDAINSHIGGTHLQDGTITLCSATALGYGAVSSSGITTLNAQQTVSLYATIENSGALVLSGTFDLSHLSLNKFDEAYVDGSGRISSSGFARAAGFSVQVVQGGSVCGVDLQLLHAGVFDGGMLELQSDGLAIAGGAVDYSTYYLRGGDYVYASSAQDSACGRLQRIDVQDGTLYLDAEVEVLSQDGEVVVSSGMLSGSLTDTLVQVRGSGQHRIQASLNGASSLVIYSGDVELARENTYLGGTILYGGSLSYGDSSSLGCGGVLVDGGTLHLRGSSLPAGVKLRSGRVVGDIILDRDSIFAVSGGVLEGNLTLSGGTLALEGCGLDIQGKFAVRNVTQLDISVIDSGLATGVPTSLLTASEFIGNVQNLQIVTSGRSSMRDFGLRISGADSESVSLEIIKLGADAHTTLYWKGGRGVLQNMGNSSLFDGPDYLLDNRFYNGDSLVFEKGGTMTLVGDVCPESIVVSGKKSLTFKSSGRGAADFGRLCGTGSLTMRGTSTWTLNAENEYSGGTVIERGTVKAGGALSFGSGVISLSGGTLDLNGKAVANEIVIEEGGSAVVRKGGNYSGCLFLYGDLKSGSSVNLEQEAQLYSGTVSGALTGVGGVRKCGDGTVVLKGANTFTGALAVDSGTLLVPGGKISAPCVSVNGGCLDFADSKYTIRSGNEFILNEGKVKGELTLSAGARLEVLHGEVEGNLSLKGGSLVLGTDGLCISGKLSILKETVICLTLPENGVTDSYTGTLFTVGALVGDPELLSVYAGSSYSSRDFVLVTHHDSAQGVSIDVVKMPGDSSLALSWQGGTGVLSHGAHSSAFETEGNFITDTRFYNGDSLLFANGGKITIVGEVMPESITVDGSKTLTFKEKTPDASISGEGQLSKYGTGTLVLNASNSYTGGTVIHEGTVRVSGDSSLGVGAVSLYGGTLDLANKTLLNDIIIEDDGRAMLKNGKKYQGSLRICGELMKGSLVHADAVEIDGGVVNGTLGGAGTVHVIGAAELGGTGRIQSGKLLLSGYNAELSVSSAGLAMNSKSSAIVLEDGASLVSAGKVTAASLELKNSYFDALNVNAKALSVTNALTVTDGSTMEMYGALKSGSLDLETSVLLLHGAKAQSVKINREAILVGAEMYVGGKMSAADVSLLQGSLLHLYDPTSAGKSMGLSVKGNMVLDDATLVLSGALSAKNLTLGSGSIALTSSKLQTIKVGGMLSFEEDADFTLNLGFSVSEKDFKRKKAFKILSFKTMGDNLTLDADLNEMLGISDSMASLAFDSKRKSITLVVTDLEAWNAYAAEVRENVYEAPEYDAAELAGAERTEEEAATAEELLLSAVENDGAAAIAVDAILGKFADTLVQSTWGTVGASRSFCKAVASRGAHATALADGKGAAWLATMGTCSRISSQAGHAGADFSLSGASFGVEARLSENSLLGLAIGNSWGKVSTFSAFPVEHDSAHVGIYGNYSPCESLTLSWMLAYTRTETEALLAGIPCDWEQEALQADVRVTWAHSISERTSLRAFAGLQYLATDSGKCAGLSTGSLQNLRGEIGAGASLRLSDNTVVYGELGLVGDMIRSNPKANLSGYRTYGSNPGRVGINMSVGGVYKLNEDWNVNASYNLELMENVTSHSFNIGAGYSF